MLLELLHHDGDGTLQLRVMSRSDILRQLFDRYIGRNTMAFNFPIPLETIDRITRRGHEAPVDESRVTADAHEASPRARAHQGAEARLAKVPGHGVAARTGRLVDNHRFGAEDGSLRIVDRWAITFDGIAQMLLAQDADNIIGQESALVEALVENHALPV